MGQWHIYKVGESYAPGRTYWPEGVVYTYSTGGHHLAVFLANPSAAEVAAIRSGPAEFAVVEGGACLWLLCRVPGALDWSAAPYSPHLVPPERRAEPPALPEGQGALLVTALVDAATGILLVLRGTGLPRPFSLALSDAIRRQLAVPWPGRAAYDRDVAVVNALGPDELRRRILPRAIARARIPARQGGA